MSGKYKIIDNENTYVRHKGMSSYFPCDCFQYFYLTFPFFWKFVVVYSEKRVDDLCRFWIVLMVSPCFRTALELLSAHSISECILIYRSLESTDWHDSEDPPVGPAPILTSLLNQHMWSWTVTYDLKSLSLLFKHLNGVCDHWSWLHHKKWKKKICNIWRLVRNRVVKDSGPGQHLFMTVSQRSLRESTVSVFATHSWYRLYRKDQDLSTGFKCS